MGIRAIGTAIIALLLGCGDVTLQPDPVEELGFGIFKGQTVHFVTGDGIGPVTVALLSLDRLVIEAVRESDADGHFRLEKIAAGRYVPVVYDFQFKILHLPQPSFSLAADDSIEATLPLEPREDPGDIRVLVGQVLDDITGEPVVGAMVDLGSTTNSPVSDRGGLFSEILGLSGSLNQVTDGEGRFRLEGLWCYERPDERFFTTAVLISHPDYESKVLPAYDCDNIPPGEVEYRLTPGDDDKRLRGRIADIDQNPVTDLLVGVEWLPDFLGQLGATWGGGDLDHSGFDGAASKVMLQGAVAITDQNGEFLFEHLPEGYFRIIAAYPKDDGWVRYPFGTAIFDSPRVHLFGVDELDAGMLLALRAIGPIAPADGAVIGVGTEFSWEAVEGAESYTFEIFQSGLVHRAIGPTSSYSPPDAALRGRGVFFWNVTAQAGGRDIAGFERFVSYSTGR